MSHTLRNRIPVIDLFAGPGAEREFNMVAAS
jgi:hypothetical protein